LSIKIPFNITANKAALKPGISKNKWKSKIFIELGAKRISAKAIHFLN